MSDNMGTGYIRETRIYDDDDLTPHDGASFETVDPGNYELEIVEASVEKPSKKGDPMVTVTYNVVANADGSETPMAGRQCRGWYVESGSEFGRRRFKQFILATGTVDKDGNYDPTRLVGVHILASIEHQVRKVADLSTGGEKDQTMQKVLKEHALPTPPATKGRRQGVGTTKSTAQVQDRR